VVKNARKAGGNRGFYGAFVVVALVGAGILGYLASRPKEIVTTTIDPNLLPKAEGYLMGNPNAPVPIMEWGDFECPGCSQFAVLTEPDLRKRLVETGVASFRFFDYPLTGHKNTWYASHAAACANEQGKFWEMHDAIFNGQDKWNGEATSNPKGIFKGYAQTIGLNTDQWTSCYDARKFQPQIEANKAEGDRRRINQTPTFVVGKRMVSGAIGYDQLKMLVDSAMAELPKAPAAPAESGKAAGAAAPTKKGG
jgi:protein-disulfide isomerase